MSSQDDIALGHRVATLEVANERLIRRLEALEKSSELLTEVTRICDNILPRLQIIERKINQ